MALDDRDRTFENALARQLRSSAAPGVKTSAFEGASAEICPDPETLAAYHDSSLSPDELNFWKQHVIACDNCQLVLAHLATPLDVPVQQKISADMPASFERVLPSLAVPSKMPPIDRKPIAIAKRPPSARWLWLVPAGAIAAGLLAWVSLHAPKPAPSVSPTSIEVAENRSPASIAVPAQSAPNDSGASKEPAKEKDQPVHSADRELAGAISQSRDADAYELRKRAQQAPLAYPAKPAPGLSIGGERQEQQAARIVAGAAGILDRKKLDAQVAPTLPQSAKKEEAKQAPPPPPPPVLEQPNGQPGFLAGGAAVSPAFGDKIPVAPVLPPTASPSASKAKTANADAISATSQSVEVTSELQTRNELGSVMRTAVLKDPHVFAAPGGKQLWRLGTAGLLEHSTNSGAKWTQQATGVNSDLLAGSAPSANVSWIAGRSGTILRTTDGGAHWTKIDSPVTNDLTGIRATDANHVWIWFSPNLMNGPLKTYQTEDGGVTWTQVPRE